MKWSSVFLLTIAQNKKKLFINLENIVCNLDNLKAIIIALNAMFNNVM